MYRMFIEPIAEPTTRAGARETSAPKVRTNHSAGPSRGFRAQWIGSAPGCRSTEVAATLHPLERSIRSLRCLLTRGSRGGRKELECSHGPSPLELTPRSSRSLEDSGTTAPAHTTDPGRQSRADP